MLRTWDIPGTVRFYTEVLGFACEEIEVSAEGGWALLRRGNAAIMLSGPNVHEGDVTPAFTGSLYFRVDDVNGFWDKVRNRAKLCYPIEDFEYGMREFAVYDTNGYLLQFGQEIP